MVEARADRSLPVPAPRAFAEATDLERADWLPAVQRLRHVGGPAGGVGARYEAEVAVAGQRLHGTLVCDQLEPPRRAVYRLEGGLGLVIAVTAEPDGPGSRVGLEVRYHIGGLAGRALERTTIGPVRREIDHALDRLAARLDSRAGPEA